MKFIILSDTHIPDRQKDIPNTILKDVENSDGIIAVGDFTNLETVLFLEKISKKFFAVHGNMDDYDVKEYLDFKKILLLENITIGLCHGWGPPFDIKKRVYDVFSEKPQIIIYGHTHTPDFSQYKGTTFLNPGAAMNKGSYAILELKDGKFKFKLVKIH